MESNTASAHPTPAVPASPWPAGTPRPGRYPGVPVEPRPDRLLRAVGCLLFVYVWRVQDIFPFIGTLQLPILLSGLAVALYVTNRNPWRRLEHLRSPIVALALGLLAVMILGIPGSLWRGASLTFTIKGFIPNLVLMGLVAASIRTTRDVEWYAKVNLYGAMFYATIVNLFFHVGANGRLGNLVYYDANDFALIVVSTIPFAIYYLPRRNGPRRRLIGLLALLLLTLAIVKSGSRGGFLGFLAVMGYVLLRYRAIPSRVRLFAGVAGVALIALLASDKYWQLMGTILHPESDYNWSEQEGRIEVWKRGIGYMISHPVLGVGVASYPVAEGTLSEIARMRAARGKGFKWSVAHNSFLETGAELGIPGLCLFVAMFGAAFRSLARIKLTGRYGPWVTPREIALAQMLIGALIGFVVCGIFVSAEYFAYLYLLFGLTVGLMKLVQVRRQATLASIPVPTRARRATPVPAGASSPGVR